MTKMGVFAVLDVGKTNVDFWVAKPDGTVLETRTIPNHVLGGGAWRHHDLMTLGQWVVMTLAELCRKHPIRLLVPVGHGSGGVLVGGDPDAGYMGTIFPMIDYEDLCPPEVDAEYVQKSGSFEDRGSPVMMGMTHAARQLLRMERTDPSAFTEAQHYLNIAQYWGWWLTGIAASEYSAMSAQTHLWNVPERRWTPIVHEQNWLRLLPDFRPAWEPLGLVRENIVRRFGLPDDIEVLTGAHDSTTNFYRYISAGLSDFTLVSTGTWLVALSREADTKTLDQSRGITINADMEGNPVAGALAMGGREFSAIAGKGWRGDAIDAQTLTRLVARGTMARPSFSDNEGQFPGSAKRGRIIGPPPESNAEFAALALLHSALLTVTCAEVLDGGQRIILDGTFLKEPLFAPLVAALCGGRKTEFSDETNGVLAGAVGLANHRTRKAPAPLALKPVKPANIIGITDYAKQWRAISERKDIT